MKTQNEDNIKVLNHLIETCKDGAKGYTEAGKDAKDAELRALFNRYASERATYAQKLAAHVRALGGDPDKSGSMSAAVHRGWINLKSAISSNEPHAVLAECERGEDSAVAAYREALEKITDPSARETISTQSAAVKTAHDNIRNLRDGVVTQKR